MQSSSNEQYKSVTLHTTLGDIEIELYYNEAPKTCYNFGALAKNKYYDNVTFHRIIKNFMIQGGDPTGTGRGGESIYGGKFEDEITPKLRHVGAGIIASANAGPNTNASQFYITLAPTPWLDGKHSIFGRVKSGMRVVKAIGMVATDTSNRPIDTIKILNCSVVTL
jgi:peptidyl-prolyl cis-trans isomerase-like 1